MLVSELRHFLAVAEASSAVLVFVRRPGAHEPEIAEVVEILDLSVSEDAVVLCVDRPE